MAIPFYEPRQQHTTECDQIDGHFPPAPPSSQPMSLPTANLGMPAAIIPPSVGTSSTFMPSNAYSTVSASSTAAFTAPAMVNTSTSFIPGLASTTVTSTTTSELNATPSAATATFSITSTNSATCTSLPSNSSSTEATQMFSSSATAPLPTEPLPWKLLAVAMCKALKQYYQQNGSNDVFTTAIIEIMPSGVGAPGQSSSAGGH